MAHVQKRCGSCKAVLGPRDQTCSACGSRRVAWRARLMDPDGRERNKTFDRRADADRFVATQTSDIGRGDWIDPRLGRLTLAAWADRQPARAGLKTKTRVGYDSLLRTHLLPRFGATPIGRIEASQVDAWIEDLAGAGLSSSRIRQAHQRLAALMDAAVRDRYIARSPCVDVTLPRQVRQEMRFLTPEELAHLVAAMPGPYDVLLEVLAWGGLRWGEAAALRRGRVKLARLTVAESLSETGGRLEFGSTKTYERRDVALPASVRDRLAAHLATGVPDDPTALVFTAAGGGPLRHSNFRKRWWLKAVGRAGLGRLRIHDLRHTCAALWIAAGAHPKTVATQLGHSSIVITMDRYGHLFPSELDRIAEVLDRLRSTAAAAAAASDGPPTAPGPGRLVELRSHTGA